MWAGLKVMYGQAEESYMCSNALPEKWAVLDLGVLFVPNKTGGKSVNLQAFAHSTTHVAPIFWAHTEKNEGSPARKADLNIGDLGTYHAQYVAQYGPMDSILSIF